MMNYQDCPELVRNYLFYLETIKGRSPNTIQGYYWDLRTFFRFMKIQKKQVPATTPLDEITIADIDLGFMQHITLSDVYEFLHFVSSNRSNQAKTRSRKVSSIRGFFKYLTNNVNLLKDNPVLNLEMPSAKKSLPKYLTLENCYELLRHIDGAQKERDFCIITLFLNCGMRLSELVGMNCNDIKNNTLLLRGKGNKERIVYLNEACLLSLQTYQQFKTGFYSEKPHDRTAVFLGKNGKRLGKRQVERIVERSLEQSGLGNLGYSTHKLRHTAATMMYQQGGVDIRVLQEILGHANLGTTQIYTHVSSDQMEQAAQSTPLSNIKPPKNKA